MKDLQQNSPADLLKIKANLNFDMVASTNFQRGVYNGTSDISGKGSGVIQNLFNQFFIKQGLTFVPLPFDGRSDYGPFLDVKIPAGLFSSKFEMYIFFK